MTATCPGCGFVAPFVSDEAERDWQLNFHIRIIHVGRTVSWPFPGPRPPGLDTYRDDVFGREN